MRTMRITDRVWAGLLGLIILAAWVFSAALFSGCVPPSQQGEGIELRGGSLKGYVLIESGDVITRIDLGTMVAAADGGAEVRVLAASVSVDADLGSAQLGVDVDKAKDGPHVVTLRWGSFSYRMQLGASNEVEAEVAPE